LSLLHAETMSPRRAWVWLCAGVLVPSAVILVATANPTLAVLPGLLLVVGYAALRLSSTQLVIVFFLVGLLVPNPRERPMMGLWHSPLYAPGAFYFDTLERVGLPGVKLFGFELVLLLLVSLLAIRRLASPPAARGAAPIPPLVVWAGSAAWMSVVAWELWGILRGGNVSFSLLQCRAMAYVAPLTFLAAGFVRTRRAWDAVLRAIVVIASVRASLAVWFWFRVLRHGVKGDVSAGSGTYASTHSDTILFVTAIGLCLYLLFDEDSWLRRAAPLGAMAIIAAGMVVNNRRIAFVGLVIGTGLLFLLMRGRLRRSIARVGIVLTPVLALYVLVGWSSSGGWAAPVRALHSVISKNDSSSLSREIENYNLMATLGLHPVTGSGFGHPYYEAIRAVDLSSIFEAFRYVPHNSILWQMGAMGPVGFFLFWSLASVCLFLAARGVRFGLGRAEKRYATAALFATTIYVLQAYGDMGLQSWLGTFLLAVLWGGVVAARSRDASERGSVVA